MKPNTFTTIKGTKYVVELMGEVLQNNSISIGDMIDIITIIK